MPQGYLPIVLTLFVIVMLGLRMSRSMRGRPINPSYLWVRPAILAVILVPMMMVSLRTDPIALASLAAALVLGAGAGYLLSRHQELSLDPKSGKIISKTSPVGVILFILLFAGRFAFRLTMVSGQAPDKIAAHSKEILFYSDLAFVFLFALVCAQAWEIRRRCLPLVAEKAALKANPVAEPATD